MPNLVGLWSPELPESEIAYLVNKQLDRVRTPQTTYVDYVSTHRGFGAGLQDHGILGNGEQPAKIDDGSLSLLLDGEIYNLVDLCTQYRERLPDCQNLTPPQRCLQLINLLGISVVNEFNGSFCLILHDSANNKLTIATDKLGFRPLFYVRRQNCFIFATEIKALSVIDPEPIELDEPGLFEFFCYGSHILDKTSIKGYMRLGPASILTLDSHEFKIEKYWNYHYDETASELDQPTYFTYYSKLFDRAVERRMASPKRVGIFLSGGYDSRAVAASIQKYHLPIPAFTFGDADSRDIRFASLLANRLGFDHYPVVTEGPYLYPSCRSVIWRTEGMLSFAHCTSVFHHPKIKDKMDIILLGFLGEFSGSHTWPKLLMARSREAAINLIYDRMTASQAKVLPRIFNKDFYQRELESIRLRFDQSFDAIANDHPLNVADSWNVSSLQPRSSYQSTSTDRHLFEARAPHMDNDLVEFLLTIPPYARIEQRIYKKMIAYGFPAIRDIPCTNSALPINPNFVQEYASMVINYALRKGLKPVRSALKMKEPEGRSQVNRCERFLLEPELMELVLKPLLNSGIFPSNIFNIDGIHSLISEHYSEQADHSESLSRLISWGEGVKYFVHRELSDVPKTIFAGD
jgi:asparagine synthase (glutamine-hydrolysing)